MQQLLDWFGSWRTIRWGLLIGAPLAVLLLTVHGFSWDDIYIVRTENHAVCEFPDGSYFEYLERYKWLFYAEPIPHAQSRKLLDRKRKYRDENGKTRDDVGFAVYNTLNDRPIDFHHIQMGFYGECESVGKVKNRAFTTDAFQDSSGKWVHFLGNVNDSGLAKVIPNLPELIPVVDEKKQPEVRSYLNDNHLFVSHTFFLVPLEPIGSLLFEQPLTALQHPSVKSGTVMLVYQSISKDFGKTWDKPSITREAKLFEIGKPETEQSWSAKTVKAWSRSTAH